MARVLVAFASRLGGTRGIAEAIGAGLQVRGHDTTIRSVTESLNPAEYDAVVVGSGVYLGRWATPAVDFVRRHAPTLATRPVWLFSSGPVGSMRSEQAFADPVDLPELRALIGPRQHRIFWGALDRSAVQGSDLGILEGLAARIFVPQGDWRDWDAIDAWAASIAGQLERMPVPA